MRIPRDFDARRARGWIDFCAKTHEAPCSFQPGNWPANLRLIDCNTAEVLFVVNNVEYVALSYVWGEYSNSVKSRGKYKLPLDLHPVIKDAMTVDPGFSLLMGRQILH
jgi:hypothetical protein